MHSFEALFVQNGLRRIAGVDEAGRGPLAGPVVAAAVVFPHDSPFFQEEKIRDSKSLTPKKRQEKYWEILAHGRVGVGVISGKLIDELNILQASLLAMRHAILTLSVTPEAVLIDGIHGVHDLPKQIEQVPIIDGDRKSISIAAASIVAKVTRDKMMEDYDKLYPQYGFSQHKGYATALHRAALAAYGPSPIHRFSFEPVARCHTVP
ncbi:MAG: ribonuclease HII [Candidatus Omnitrophica bacterium CG11_big_fil_rev_8_21_14_0_20_45_26]|uniref:Ribonuclease HII n=1 Tax=Candidatus Abzuiibacterium crystallinum TaxID=1974748 RepID=A0A2H0LMA5_9BACT|nr:MAG: ribonuclease HII [Candidatus Omnitrophica bacterium CG11_big_fil_rev_8_21_14_0_20_45_26]PIW63707.1 MAG: ribonuclease HII [Candidatus Omnitrophica bacterium CG12_big_fil_rev_8_21_14_0_65_45_16]